MIKQFLKPLYRAIFPDYPQVLNKLVKNCDSLLDVGCGSNSPVQHISNPIYKIGLDGHRPSIAKSKKKKIHDKYFEGNILKIDTYFKPKSIDCILLSDVIEHLTKAQGLALLKKIEAIAKKKVIVFTPNGFLPQHEYDKNTFQIHKSGWKNREMRHYGYKVIGMLGWKPLRGEYAKIKYKPKMLWSFISDLTQLITRFNPTHAFYILCIKEFQ